MVSESKKTQKDLEDYLNRVSSALAKERSKRNLTYEQLAELSGISRFGISKIEKGSRNPSLYTIHKLCKGMDIPTDEFIKKLKLK